jgi:hypothetical protein
MKVILAGANAAVVSAAVVSAAVVSAAVVSAAVVASVVVVVLQPANEKAATIDILNISTITHVNDFFIFKTPFLHFT